jgi:hypothetical protein
MTTSKTQAQRPSWLHHFVYRKETWRTTWKLRVGLLVVGFGVAILTRSLWTARLAQSLVCTEHAPPSDALLLENFDPEYLVFERAETLRRAGVAPRILVPLSASDGETPSTVESGLAELMAKVAHLPEIEGIPIQLKEPISLNAAYQIRAFLTQKNIRSVIVVAPGFRSRRSELIYRTTLNPTHISVGCVPVFGKTTPQNWSETTHGIQGVVEQFLKLQYYNLYKLRW